MNIMKPPVSLSLFTYVRVDCTDINMTVQPTSVEANMNLENRPNPLLYKTGAPSRGSTHQKTEVGEQVDKTDLKR